MTAVYLFLAAVFLLTAAVCIYIAAQGDEAIVILPEEREKLVCELTDERRAVFSLKVPFANAGRQDGIVLDAFARPLLPQEQFDLGILSIRLEREGFRRSDGYLEAFIARAGMHGNFILTMEFTPKKGVSMPELFAGMVDITIDIYCALAGRTAPKIIKTALLLPLEEIRSGAAKEAGA
ncbi:MAG: hypothetical protein LBP78_02790 [Acidaminococcales bacterium]|nr:hypothetical protein [Acidaminococcales bacterium]